MIVRIWLKNYNFVLFPCGFFLRKTKFEAEKQVLSADMQGYPEKLGLTDFEKPSCSAEKT